MATESFLESVVLTNQNEIMKFQQILSSDSPRKDIKPISYDELKEREKQAEQWKKRFLSR